MPQYITKQISSAITFSRPTLSKVEYPSGYLLFNTREWIHKNQGPWFGESYSIAKKTEHDQLCASTQSLPKINHMLIPRIICIQWKSSRFLFPVSARNAWEPNLPFVSRLNMKEENGFQIMTLGATQPRVKSNFLNILKLEVFTQLPLVHHKNS